MGSGDVTSNGEQDIGLYYKGSTSDKTNIAPKIETAFNANNSSGGSSQGSNNNTRFSSYPSVDPNFSATNNGQVLQCYIALHLQNGQNFSEEVAKGHMSLLVTVLESYESLVAGRIGNPMLTKEDYDQIDAEEMELMDIKWCMASVGKGHFKRECTNREASGTQNPFGNNDYHRKAIYHQVAQQPHQQQSSQTSHARKDLIKEPSKKAYLVHQEDERIPEGFNWDKYDRNRMSESQEFVAQIVEEEMAYVYYESQQFSPKKTEEEPVSTREALEKAPIFDHSSDEESDDDSEEIQKLEYYKRKFSSDRNNLYFAGKMEEIKPEENVRAVKKQVKKFQLSRLKRKQIPKNYLRSVKIVML
ncbi:hypothetical protein HanIR_Chr13g0626241 [Helianthus annuus]|nr:hypothetical protein HanIR_Chr13g0626241 [Helianthus annuus]